MEVHGDHPVHTGMGKEVGHELGGDGDSRTVLAVLTGVSVIGENGGDACGAGASGGIHHDHELHEIFIDGSACGLDDEDIGPADVFLKLDADFAIGEVHDVDLPQTQAEVIGDGPGQPGVGRSGIHANVFCRFHSSVPVCAFPLRSRKNTDD